MRKTIVWILNILATSILLVGAVYSRVLRDGLGPDSVNSEGTEAVTRFFETVWGFLQLTHWLPAILSAALFVTAWYLRRLPPNESLQPTGPKGPGG